MRGFALTAFVVGSAWIAACGSSETTSGTAGDAADSASSAPERDAATSDAAIADTGDASVAVDSGPDGGCFVETVGVYGACISTADCASIGAHTSTAGFCPGAANIECCWLSPNVADNPPIPAGWKLMTQADVTPDMTTWAVAILKDPTTYPMFATTTRTFGALDVLARVEWHPPDFQNATIHRGVTLYEAK
ncbi:MAG: hypothetical protein ABI461_23185 [Polyangiaceae bacterium]